jgi:hypothetical protein
MERSLLVLATLTLVVACAAEPDPPPGATAAAPPDRPLDSYLGDPTAVRAAVLTEVALAQVRPGDLGHCLDEFGRQGAARFRPPAHGGWLIVTSALPADGAAFARRQEAAPELHPDPDDGWLDRIVYRALLRTADAGEVACLSCVFDYEGGRVTYRHAYALDTCRRAVPPERDLAIAMPLG